MNSEREMYISVPYLAVARSQKSAEALEFSRSGKRKARAKIWSKNSLNRVEQSADRSKAPHDTTQREGRPDTDPTPADPPDATAHAAKRHRVRGRSRGADAATDERRSRRRTSPRAASDRLETAPGDADDSPRNSAAPWRRTTPPTTAPARPAFAGVSEPRLPPPAARAEATGAPHATVPGEHRGSREVSGEQHGRQRCRSNRWAVRVALTCPCTSSASYKRILLGRPVRVKGAGYNRVAHNRRKHSSERLPGECIDGHVGSNNGPQAVTKGGDRYTDLSEGARLMASTKIRCSPPLAPRATCAR